MASLGLALDLGILLLLGVVIGYAIVLDRRLRSLRSAKEEMRALMAEFGTATGRAQSSLQAIKEISASSGEALDLRAGRAVGLVEDLNFLIERGEALANRLEGSGTQVRQSVVESQALPAFDQRTDRHADAAPGAGRPAATPARLPLAKGGQGTRGAALVKALREMR